MSSKNSNANSILKILGFSGIVFLFMAMHAEDKSKSTYVTTRASTRTETKSKLSEAEADFAKCLISMDYEAFPTTEKKVGCYEMVKVYHPDANLSRIENSF